MSLRYSLSTVSETDVQITFHAPLSPALAVYLHHLQQSLHKHLGQALVDSVLAYERLLLCFSPQHSLSPKQRETHLNAVLQQLLAHKTPKKTRPTLTLPVYYGPEAGADFNSVCEQTGLSAEALIQLHSSTLYHVYALGFSPGFAFLGELPHSLRLPRRATPRLTLPPGSVAIAHGQTAIYPQSSPGGWHLIGRCPKRLFHPQKEPPHPFTVGQAVRFEPISHQTYLSLGGEL